MGRVYFLLIILTVVQVSKQQTGGATAGAPLAPLGDDQILGIQFSPNNDDGQRNVYKYSGALTVSGNPASEFSVCTWFKMNRQRGTDYIAVIQPPVTNSDVDESAFYFLNIGVAEGQLTILTRNCFLHYDQFIPTRQWIHLCVSLNQSIAVYYNGEEIHTNGDCFVNGTEILTSSNSVVTLGASPFTRENMDGVIAETKIYPHFLTEEQAGEIKNFGEQINDYVDLISRQNTLLSRGINYVRVKKDILTTVDTNNMFLYMENQMNFTDAQKTCKNFGGYLFKPENDGDNQKVVAFMKNGHNHYMFELWYDNNGQCYLASGTLVDILLKKRDCSEEYSFICTLPSTVEFKMIFESKATPTAIDPAAYSFMTDKAFTVEYDEIGILHLINGFSGDKLMSLRAPITTAEIMGRKNNWASTDDSVYATSSTLTLSSCNSNQFTCDNGQCIDIFDICNFQVDCDDSSDEQSCNSTQSRPKFYDAALSGGSPLNVAVKVSLNNILNVDMGQSAVKIYLTVMTNWSDPRVEFHNLHPGSRQYISPEDASHYWKPNIRFTGVEHSDIFTFSLYQKAKTAIFITPSKNGVPSIFGSHEVLVHSGSDVEMSGYISNIITLDCTMNLFTYPFDLQTCKFYAHLEGRVKYDADWDIQKMFVDYREDIAHPLYEFIGFTGSPANNTENDGSWLELQLTIARRFGSDLLVTFLPCILLQVIGLCVFAIPMYDLTDRLTVSVSCLIVQAAFFTQLSIILPASAAPKMIDIWMFIHVLMLAIVFVLQLVLNYFYDRMNREDVLELKAAHKAESWTAKISDSSSRYKGEKFSKKINWLCFIICSISYIIFVIAFFAYCYAIRYRNYRAFSDHYVDRRSGSRN